jgi:phosphatidylinositol kinase/protein kinase (PI-3  family)
MTLIQVKSEIKKVIDQVPENLLPEIFDYLKQVQHQTPDQLKFNNNLNKIFSEDKELLQRLAE